jgi:hypothetical protein
MNKIKQFFWFCSGAYPDLLKKCPSESDKYIGIGGTVLFTGIFAFISGGYATYTVFQSWWLFLFFGLLWGAMIFNLDRYIVSSLRKENKFGKELKMAVPRIILAVILALVISKPLELKIFEPEIKGELVILEQQLFKEQEENLKQRFAPEKIALQADISNLKQEILAKTAQRDALMQKAQEEADGTGGSGRRNLGPIYKAKKADADSVAAELEILQNQNQALINNKLAALNQLDTLQKAEIEGFDRVKYDGLAARLEALSIITAKSEAIKIANIFIILLFIAIETAPLFVKLISQKGPYDELLQAHEYRYKMFRLGKTAKLHAATDAELKRLHPDNPMQAFVPEV